MATATKKTAPAPAPAPSVTRLEIKASPERQHALDTRTEATTLVVSNVDTHRFALGMVKGVKELRRTIVDHYAQIKKPIRDALEQVLSMERADLAPVQEAEQALTVKIRAYENEEQRRADEEQRRLQAEADAKAKADRDKEAARLKAAAKVAETPQAKQALTQQSKQVAAAPIVAQSIEVKAQIAKVDGVASTTSYSHEVTNKTVLVLAVAAEQMLRDLDEQPALTEADAMLQSTVRRYLRGFLMVDGQRCTPTSVEMLEVRGPALTPLVRALGRDLRLPGVVVNVKHGLRG